MMPNIKMKIWETCDETTEALMTNLICLTREVNERVSYSWKTHPNL